MRCCIHPTVVFVYLSIPNGLCIKYDLMASWSFISFSGQWEFIGSSFAPYFVIVSTHVDKLRNMKSHFVLVVAFEIPFILYLI